MNHAKRREIVQPEELILLYINDIPVNLPDAKTVLFADDTNIIYHNIEKNCLQVKINETLIK